MQTLVVSVLLSIIGSLAKYVDVVVSLAEVFWKLISSLASSELSLY